MLLRPRFPPRGVDPAEKPLLLPGTASLLRGAGAAFSAAAAPSSARAHRARGSQFPHVLAEDTREGIFGVFEKGAVLVSVRWPLPVLLLGVSQTPSAGACLVCCRPHGCCFGGNVCSGPLSCFESGYLLAWRSRVCVLRVRPVTLWRVARGVLSAARSGLGQPSVRAAEAGPSLGWGHIFS